MPDGTAEFVARDQILRREREQGEKNSLSSDQELGWQPYLYLVDLYYNIIGLIS